MLQLDGSYLEGGGQIVRTALALSMYTGKPFTVEKIRLGRPEPGLKAQHLHCIKALLELTNNKAKEDGAELRSTNLTFYPAKISKSRINIDIGTAGSVTLLLQSLLLPIALGEKSVTLSIRGGTDTQWSPLFDYFKEVIIPQLERFAEFNLLLKKRGFYPKGGGEIELKIKPFKLEHLPEIIMNVQGKLMQIMGKSFATKNLENARVAERQAESAEMLLRQTTPHINISCEYNESLSTGSGIVLWAVFRNEAFSAFPVILGADELGEKGKRAEDVGRNAAEKLIKQIKSEAVIDSHLADNLIPFLGICGGEIKTSNITNHTLTNIYVTERFLDVKFKVDKENNIIKVEK